MKLPWIHYLFINKIYKRDRVEMFRGLFMMVIVTMASSNDSWRGKIHMTVTHKSLLPEISLERVDIMESLK